MLSIRLQRTGRKGHAQYRIIAQDSRFSPTSGRYAALLGTYNPHTKEVTIDKESAEKYLSNGAQPSDRVISLFEKEKITLPAWVKKSGALTRSTRNPGKLKRNTEAEPEAEVAEEPAVVAEDSTESAETVEEKTAEAPEEEATA